MHDQRSGSVLNRGALGIPGIVFLVLAAVTPIGSVAGPVSLGLLLGNGPGLPGAYLLAGIVLLLFAVGYAAMSHQVANAVAFYTYITKASGVRPARSSRWSPTTRSSVRSRVRSGSSPTPSFSIRSGSTSRGRPGRRSRWR